MDLFRQIEVAMGGEVALGVAEIEPLAIVEHHRAESADPGEFEKGRDHRDFALADEIEQTGGKHIDPGKHVGPGGAAEHFADVSDLAIVMGDVFGGSGRAQGEGGEISRCLVGGDQRGQREGGENVAIVDEDRVAGDPFGDVADAAAGFQQLRFMEKVDGAVLPKTRLRGQAISPAQVGLRPRTLAQSPERVGPGGGQMVGVDRKFLDPGERAGLGGPFDHGAVKQGHERLGQAIGERSEAGAQPCSQQECLANHGPPMTAATLVRQGFFPVDRRW